MTVLVRSRDQPTPETQGFVIPRQITAPWLVIPPLNETTPTEASIPWMSSGVTSGQRRTARLPAPASLRAESAENAATPVAAPALAGSPLPSSRTFESMITVGARIASTSAGSIRLTRVLPVIFRSRNRSVAMRIAASGVRLPTRALSTYNLPSCTVNSKSHMSRKADSSLAATSRSWGRRSVVSIPKNNIVVLPSTA